MATETEVREELAYEGYADPEAAIKAAWRNFLRSGNRLLEHGTRWPVPLIIGIAGPRDRAEATAVSLIAFFTRETGYLEGKKAWRVMGEIEGVPGKIEMQVGLF